MLTENSYNVTPEELFDLFGKFGPIRYVQQRPGRRSVLTKSSQIRQGIANNTKGTAFVVYEDVMDAKQACDKLNGFNFQNRYLVGMSIGPLRSQPTNFPSTIPPTRQDGQVETRPGGTQGEFRAAQEAARYRITSRRACGSSTSFTTSKRDETNNQKGFCRPVYEQEGKSRYFRYWERGEK
jgi:RNA recognition motif-containing protein